MACCGHETGVLSVTILFEFSTMLMSALSLYLFSVLCGVDIVLISRETMLFRSCLLKLISYYCIIYFDLSLEGKITIR